MQRSSGFTLIELMITVVIVTILTAVALPSYQDHVRRAARSAGQQFLLDLAQRQEQYFLDVRWYADGTEIDPMMLALSTYLGHAEIYYTYWYLTALCGAPHKADKQL